MSDMQGDDRCSFLHGNSLNVVGNNRPVPTLRQKLDYLSEMEETGTTDTETTSSSLASSHISTELTNAVSVYLRLKADNENNGDDDLYRVENNTLITRQTENSTMRSSQEKHYSFTDVFPEATQQAEIYNKCVHDAIINSDQFTILTYGTSGSGKTYTLLGDIDNPGILPRALEQIFTQYHDKINLDPLLKVENTKLICVGVDDVEREKQLRNNLLMEERENSSIYNLSRDKILGDHVFLPSSNNLIRQVFVWISFVEIYNESVYDLFSPTLFKTGSRMPTTSKIISNKGQAYIKNMTGIHVRNAEEAYSILLAGLKKVRYASTLVNSNSSRSHFIFFVNLVVVKMDTTDQYVYKFCDLAGSERLKKTETSGCRLKETQRINTSLMVLGRCLTAVHNNQHGKSTELIPFRESKLTLLLQAALQGKEKLSMIVNLNPSNASFEENVNVLTFSSIARELKIVIPKERKPKRYSNVFLPYYQPRDEDVKKRETDSFMLDENFRLKEEISELLAYIHQLKRDALRNEQDIRNQLTNDYLSRRQRMEETYNQRMIKKEELLRKGFAIREEAYVRACQEFKNTIEDLREKLKKFESVDVQTNDQDNEDDLDLSTS